MLRNLIEGVRHSSGENIVHVETAPYTVVVRCVETGALCTGTLIALDVVLTVARCFYQGVNSTPSSVVVLAGLDHLNLSYHLEDYDGSRIQWQPGVKLMLHPNFHPTLGDPFFGYNDLAMIITEHQFNETPTVRAITVGHLDWSKTHSVKCQVASYGAVNPFTPSPYDDYLKMSEVLVTRPCTCHEALLNAFDSRIHRWLCARPDKSGPVPCVGAGGAALVCGNQMIGLLVGLVSFNDLHQCRFSRKSTRVSCLNTNSLPVFLDICPFIPFLKYINEDLDIHGPVNCSKASQLTSSLYVVLVIIMITCIKGKS